jgi:CubicO group peptidase (beta-lactamase class C family)
MPISRCESAAAAQLRGLLAQALQAHAWPGGILALAGSEAADVLIPHGLQRYEGPRAVRATDYVDLASLTKVVATTTATMLGVERGLLELDDPVAGYLPGFLDLAGEPSGWRRAVTIRHLLSHSAGFPAHVAFHRRTDLPPAARQQAVLATALAAAPGHVAVYSDIGLMVLGFVLDAAFGRPWPRVLREAVFAPLGMRQTRFGLPPSRRGRALPTECTAPGGEAWQGVVHDENARWLGGVAGHAGLFATAADLCRFARLLLRGGMGPRGRILEAATIAAFTRPAGLVAGSSRCLGWDSPAENGSGGVHLSTSSFGHTGFTGTSLWIDPDADLAVILLTNAVHPRRECRSERGFFEWRRRVHSAVYEALGLAQVHALGKQ